MARQRVDMAALDREPKLAAANLGDGSYDGSASLDRHAAGLVQVALVDVLADVEDDKLSVPTPGEERQRVLAPRLELGLSVEHGAPATQQLGLGALGGRGRARGVLGGERLDQRVSVFALRRQSTLEKQAMLKLETVLASALEQAWRDDPHACENQRAVTLTREVCGEEQLAPDEIQPDGRLLLPSGVAATVACQRWRLLLVADVSDEQPPGVLVGLRCEQAAGLLHHRVRERDHQLRASARAVPRVATPKNGPAR